MLRSRRIPSLREALSRPAAAAKPRKFAPAVERLEARELLANSFLQGLAYHDLNANNQFDPDEPRLANATIRLFRGNEQTPLRQTTTAADGTYSFENLPPGDYRLEETPPTGFWASSAQGRSQINPSTIPPGTRNRIDVRLLDPDGLSAEFVRLGPNLLIAENGVELFGRVPVGFQGGFGNVGQLVVEVTRPGLPAINILSFCAELAVAEAFPDGPFRPERMSGPIGYLFNRYATRLDLTPLQAAGLQFAIWEFLYDPNNPNLTNGNLVLVSQQPERQAIIDSTTAFINEARNRSEPISFLRTTDPINQSFLDTGSFIFGNQRTAGLDGYKWHDLNANARWDAGEPVLAGWTIQLLQNNAVVGSTTTGPNGQYRFDNLVPGTYQVREVLQTGWVQSYPAAPGTYTVTLASGQNFSGTPGGTVTPNFGNYQPGRAAGQVTHQAPDCTGIRDRGGQANVTVFLDDNDNGQLDPNERRTVTDANGRYEFPNLTPGTYRVRQVVQGWTQLSAPAGTFTITSGQSVAGLDFRNELPLDLNMRCGEIRGQVTFQVPTCTTPQDRGGLGSVRVYVDANNNGRFDAGEPNAVTDAAGNYRIADLGRGTHVVRLEVLNPQWTVLGPASFEITRDTPIFSVPNVNFRLQLPPTEPLRCGTISGRVTFQVPTCTVPEDRGGRQGVTVYVDANDNGRPDAGEVSAVTAADGRYVLGPLGAGTHRVRYVLPAGLRAVSRTQADVAQAGPTFTVGGVDFVLEIVPAVPPVCPPLVTDRVTEIFPTFPGVTPPVLTSDLGGKLQLLGSTLQGGPDGGLLGQAAFVTGLYRNLLNRAPDSAGLVTWVSALQGGIARVQVVTAIQNSREARGVQVEYYYLTYLGRPTDPGGKEAWVNALQGGMTEKEFLSRLLGSPEYFARSNSDGGTYVSRLYAQILGRQPDGAGHAAWVQALQSGTTREGVALAFLSARESSQRVLDLIYTSYLGRRPDPAGQEAWLSALGRAQLNWGDVARAVLASEEYFTRLHNLARAGQ